MSRGLRHANRIREYREASGYITREVVFALQPPYFSYFYRWENGRHLPSLHNAFKLAILYRCPVEALFLEYYNQCREEVQSRLKLYEETRGRLGWRFPSYDIPVT
jgi:transcriptional regulator with XRE-family HTH domain